MMKTQKSKSLTRRKFLGTVGIATAAFTIVPRHAMAGRNALKSSNPAGGLELYSMATRQ